MIKTGWTQSLSLIIVYLYRRNFWQQGQQPFTPFLWTNGSIYVWMLSRNVIGIKLIFFFFLNGCYKTVIEKEEGGNKKHAPPEKGQMLVSFPLQTVTQSNLLDESKNRNRGAQLQRADIQEHLQKHWKLLIVLSIKGKKNGMRWKLSGSTTSQTSLCLLVWPWPPRSLIILLINQEIISCVLRGPVWGFGPKADTLMMCLSLPQMGQ